MASSLAAADNTMIQTWVEQFSHSNQLSPLFPYEITFNNNVYLTEMKLWGVHVICILPPFDVRFMPIWMFL